MSATANAKQWQRNRAIELHSAFVALAARVQGEGVKLMASLETLSRALDGKLITAGVCGDRRLVKALRCSAKTLYKEWGRWHSGGCKAEALLLGYKYVAPRQGDKKPLPTALAAEVQRRCTLKTGGVGKSGLTPIADIYQWLRDDWNARRPLPGISYDDYPDGAEFPWSARTITRHAPAKAERALGNRGVAAFKARAAHVTMDYSMLRKCELFTLDDARLDLLCVNDLGRAVVVKIYVLMEVASRLIVAFFMKPDSEIHQEDVDELIARGLQTPGFGIGVDYPTHILFERGTVACSDAAKAALEGITQEIVDGELLRGLCMHRTGMNGGVTWIGSERDRATGNACGKGVIESFHRRLHSALRRLPGQIGSSHENTPASVGFGTRGKGGDAMPGSLIWETERLEKFAIQFGKSGKGRLKLQLPMLRVREVEAAVAAAIERHNHEPGHDYADHGKFAQEEVAPGVWKDSGLGSFSEGIHDVPAAEAPASNGKVYVLDTPAKPLTPQQRNGMYWRLWKAAETAHPGLNRFALTSRVLGRVLKITEMTDEQFLKICHVFESIAKKSA